METFAAGSLLSFLAQVPDLAAVMDGNIPSRPSWPWPVAPLCVAPEVTQLSANGRRTRTSR